jgi:hypothetical protein
VCRGLSAITANTLAMNSSVTPLWNRSDIEFTNTSRGLRHRKGSSRTSGCMAMPKPGPLVRGSPSVWYFAEPIALRRLAMPSA